jgi:hypothetical protein
MPHWVHRTSSGHQTIASSSHMKTQPFGTNPLQTTSNPGSGCTSSVHLAVPQVGHGAWLQGHARSSSFTRMTPMGKNSSQAWGWSLLPKQWAGYAQVLQSRTGPFGLGLLLGGMYLSRLNAFPRAFISLPSAPLVPGHNPAARTDGTCWRRHHCVSVGSSLHKPYNVYWAVSDSYFLFCSYQDGAFALRRVSV